MDAARSPPAQTADAGRTEAASAPREPGATGAACGRGPALDRLRDAGVAGPAGRERADGAGAAAGELPAGIRARLGEQDLLPAGAARPAPDDERDRAAGGPARNRERPRGAKAAPDRAHARQSLLPRGERAGTRRDAGPRGGTRRLSTGGADQEPGAPRHGASDSGRSHRPP